MLIVLNAVETVNRKWLAKQLTSTLNTFEVDGYTVDFLSQPFKVKDSSGQVVYQFSESTGTSGITSILNPNNTTSTSFSTTASNETLPAGAVSLQKIFEIESFLNTHERHYSNVFVDLNFDFKYTPSFEGEQHVNESYCYPVDYTSMISSYKESTATFTLTNFVISGAFSRHILDQIKNDVGADDVKIINIIRNPSACFIAHPRTDAYFEENPSYSRSFHDERLPKSIINAANLIQYSDVQTIKFEDIVASGKITVNGTDVEVSIPMFNQWLTVEEKTRLDATLAEIPTATADQFVQAFSDQNQLYQTIGTTKRTPWIPDNIFELLGYTPVDYTTITQS